MKLLNDGNEHVRDLGCARVGEVLGKLGHAKQHLLLCYGGVGGMEIRDKGGNSEQEVDSHTFTGRLAEREKPLP